MEDKKPKKIAEPLKPAVKSAPAQFSLSFRYLRKRDGSTVLQEGLNDVWTDVPTVVEK
jgi:hypothetical protein